MWIDVDSCEFWAFLGLIILGGLEKPRKKPWSELWSRKDEIGLSPFIATMSLGRFYEIMSALRFDDVAQRHAKVEAQTKEESSQEKLQQSRTTFNPFAKCLTA